MPPSLYTSGSYLSGIISEGSRDPPHLLRVLARGKGGADAGLGEVRGLPRRALVARGIQDVRGGRGREWRFHPSWHGGYRGLLSEVRLAEEDVSEAHVRLRRHLLAH